MTIQHVLQKCLDDWSRISHLDFCLLNFDNSVFVSTCSRKLPAASKLQEFRESSALCVSNTSNSLFKVSDSGDTPYILVVWGSKDSMPTIGELAVCQVESLLCAYTEKRL